MYSYVKRAAAAATAALAVCCCTTAAVAAAAAACCLLLFVLVCRMAKIVAGSMNLNSQLLLHEHRQLVVRSPACALFFIRCAVFFSPLLLFGAVCFHNRVLLGPDISDIILLM